VSDVVELTKMGYFGDKSFKTITCTGTVLTTKHAKCTNN